MSKYLFDMEAYSYSQGIKAIQLMFEAAKGALNAHHSDLEIAKVEYDRHLEAGENQSANGKRDINSGIRKTLTALSNWLWKTPL